MEGKGREGKGRDGKGREVKAGQGKGDCEHPEDTSIGVESVV